MSEAASASKRGRVNKSAICNLKSAICNSKSQI
jgi:hypothetical protein